jgi:hypothetical protein
MRALISFLIVLGLVGCGKKFPMPPQSEGGLPPESSYVSVEVWDEYDGARDILRGGDGYLYLIDGTEIRKLQLNQVEVQTAFDGLVDPVRLAFGANRNVYVAEGGTGVVKVFDTEGQPISTFQDTLVTLIQGIALDDSMNLYVSDTSSDLVLRYDSLDALVDTVAKRGEGNLFVEDPGGLSVSSELALLFVASTGHNWVEGLTLETPVTNAIHLGGSSHDGDTAEGYFLEPVDVDVDAHGDIFVADRGNQRVQKFKSSGEFATAFRSRNWPDSEARPVGVTSSSDGSTVYVVMEDGTGTAWVEIFELVPEPEEPD